MSAIGANANIGKKSFVASFGGFVCPATGMQQIAVRFNAAEYDSITALAAKHNVSRARVIRALLGLGLEEFRRREAAVGQSA